ncbi:hypothetical protein ACJJIQ_14100 [Microbulbifer sp. ANSA003]|uniref:hypothetical protein n=1 Tax=Microbulbifer sp. ANSA003 TaxID=3243360 RepID=UPI004041B5EF
MINKEELEKIIGVSYKPLGEVAQRFINYAVENKSLHVHEDYRKRADLPAMIQNFRYAVQSWPFFVSTEYMKEVEQPATVFPALLTKIPELFFDNDSNALCDFFDIEDRTLVNMLLNHKWSNESIISRGDFINTEDGLKCLEQNMGSNIGGWELEPITKSYMERNALKSFLNDNQVKITGINIVHRWFNYAVSLLKKHPELYGDGPLNLFICSTSEYRRDGMQEHFEGVFAQVLQEHGMTGSLVLSTFDQLKVVNRDVHYGDLRVHATLNPLDMKVPLELLRAYMSSRVYFVDNMLSFIYGDKRALALLSANADNAELFSAKEQEVINKHLPWTRDLRDTQVVYQGEEWNIRELAIAQQAQFVLKHAKGTQGRDLYIGCKTTKEKWQSVVNQTKEDATWVLQQYYKSNSYLAQSGVDAKGFGVHHFIWGTFCFGEELGRIWMRLLAVEHEKGVINNCQGAQQTQVFVADI